MESSKNRGRKNAFARQFLHDHNVEVYRGRTQLLTPVQPLHEIRLPNTRYFVGDRLVERGLTKEINSNEILKEMGLAVQSVQISAKERWSSMQRTAYFLVKTTEITAAVLNKIPPKHYIEHDVYQKDVRLRGPNAGPLGYGPWVSLESTVQDGRDGSGRKITSKGYIEKSEDLINGQIKEWLDIEDEPEPVYIEECAFMVTDSNEIVCFPRTADMPSIGVFGQRGTGKSYATHSISSRFFWKPLFDFKIVILNDSSAETGTWSLPNEDHTQTLTLRKLNEKPLPLPIVYLHPLIKEDYQKFFLGNVGFNITIPFKDIIDNPRQYLNLGMSYKYFMKFREQFRNCETEEEADAFLDTVSVAFGVPENSANKIRAEFEAIFETGMTDISWDEQELWSTSKNPGIKYNALTACVHAGVVPVLMTEYLSNDPAMLSIYFMYFVKDLFRRQTQDPDFVKESSQLFLVVDEAHNISDATTRTGANMLLRRCVREGRPRRIGTLITSQQFNDLPRAIQGNLTYVLCFKNAQEANDIANRYNMGRGIAQMIKDLGKHECIAYTTDYFIIYDSNGNRRRSKLNEVFKGKTLPPYSQHKRPRAKGGQGK